MTNKTLLIERLIPTACKRLYTCAPIKHTLYCKASKLQSQELAAENTVDVMLMTIWQ